MTINKITATIKWPITERSFKMNNVKDFLNCFLSYNDLAYYSEDGQELTVDELLDYYCDADVFEKLSDAIENADIDRVITLIEKEVSMYSIYLARAV